MIGVLAAPYGSPPSRAQRSVLLLARSSVVYMEAEVME